MNSSVLVTHPRGNSNVRQVLQALNESHQDFRYATTLGWGESRFKPQLARLLPGFVRTELDRRTYVINDSQIERARTSHEALRLAVARMPRSIARDSAYSGRLVGVFAVAEAFDKAVSQKLRRIAPQVVYGYEDTSVHTFASAASLGATRILEIPYAHYEYVNDVLRAEAERQPEFAVTRPAFLSTARSQHHDRKDREIQLASKVVVPSRQVLKSLEGVVHAENVIFNPYGLEACPQSFRQRHTGGTRFLFVGRLQSDKGIAYLAEARAVLGSKFLLTVIGSRPNVACPALDRFLNDVRYLGTMPRARVIEEMHQADVFILPSLVEGRSLAALEAISHGLVPVVTTGTGVDDLVQDGVDGRVISTASTQSIVDAVEQLLDAGTIESMREARNNRADGQWSDYRATVVSAIARCATPL